MGKNFIFSLFSNFINNLIVKMFGDLKTAAGVKALNDYLAENSYIEGYVPSQADTAVFEALSGAPKDAPHALRWYNHIKSFAAGMKQFPKAQKDAASYVSGGEAEGLPREEVQEARPDRQDLRAVGREALG